MGRFQLESIYLYFPPSSQLTRPVDNVVIATKGLQDRNVNILAGTTVENKGKLILTHRGLSQSEDYNCMCTNYIIN